MPAKPVSISFVAEVAEYLRATKKVEVSTEDIADALVAVSKDAKTLERDLNRAMREAAKDPERLKRVVEEVGDALDKVGDKAKGTARNMGRDFNKVSDDLGEVGKEGASELKQNLAEGLSSGNLEDVVQSTLGGVVSGLNGVVGGVAAALAGLGALALNQLRVQAEEDMAAVVAIGDAAVERMKELGSQILTSKDASDILLESVEEQPEAWQRIRAKAEELGVDWFELSAAVIEGGSKGQEAYDTLAAIIRDDVLYESGKYGTSLGDQGRLAQSLLRDLQDQAGAIADAKAEFDIFNDAQERARDLSGEVKRNWQAAKDAARGMRGEIPYYGGNTPL